MKIDLDKFLALTAMLAAPLVTASGCILTGSDDDNDTGSGGTGNSADDGSDPTGNPTSVGDDAQATDDAATDDAGTGGTETGGTGADGTGSTGVADSTGGNELGNCCEVHDEASCEVMEVADCVCAEDPFCCEMTWDMTCVQSVNDLLCGMCELPPMVWDCTCVAACDGTPVDTVWQVCSGDAIDAATMGTAACEAELDPMCTEFSCETCECFTSEVPEIDCP